MLFSTKTHIIFLIVCLMMTSCGIGMDTPLVNGFTQEVIPRTEIGEVASSTNSAYTSDYLTAYLP